MRILQINKFYYLKGGSERYFFELSDMLEKNGHTVLPFSMADSQNDYSKYNKYFINKVELNKFNLKNIIKIFYNYDAVKRLKKLIKDEKPDIAHLHNIAHQISPAIINVLKKNNIPIVQTLHDYKLICPNCKLCNSALPENNILCEKCITGKYYNCLLNKCAHNSRAKSFLQMLEAYWHKKTYQNIALFIAPSQFMKDMCVKAGIPAYKIKVVNHFVSEEIFKNEGKKKKIDHKNSYLLFYGRLVKEKGIYVLLNALEKTHKQINLKIVGSGIEKNNLKIKIQNSKLKGRVEILTARYGEDLYSIIKNSKVVIVPSICCEVLPYALIESIAMAKPIIASKIGGMQEIIKDGINGFLFEPGNSAELAEKIKKLDTCDLTEISNNAFKTSLNFNSKKHYHQIYSIYSAIFRKN